MEDEKIIMYFGQTNFIANQFIRELAEIATPEEMKIILELREKVKKEMPCILCGDDSGPYKPDQSIQDKQD